MACHLLSVFIFSKKDVQVEILFVSRDMPVVEEAMIDEVLAEHGAGAHRVDSYKKAVEALVRRKYGTAILYFHSRGDDFNITETVRIMKEISPTLSIIAITQETSLETERELRKLGLYFHLTTPFDKSELVDVLSSAIVKNKRKRKNGTL
jgi:DNA-binding NtrC family response regulator